MTPDLIAFWADVPGAARAHPADQKVLDRSEHGFQLDCLPGPFKGPLRTAPVVLLALSPGFREAHRDLDRALACSAEGQAYYARQRTGECPLPSETEHEGSSSWSQRIIRQFGIPYEAARSRVAVLNAGPYKSKNFDDWHMLTALSSARAAVAWAQDVLFPEAEAGNRVVVCLRSPQIWGLRRGERYGSLFAPICGRNGIMNRGPMRDEVTAAVQAAVGGSGALM